MSLETVYIAYLQSGQPSQQRQLQYGHGGQTQQQQPGGATWPQGPPGSNQYVRGQGIRGYSGAAGNYPQAYQLNKDQAFNFLKINFMS